jgi:hypothetical protein
MSRAFICLARNDLDENLLQVLDLDPNTSQRNSVLDGAGQTGYVSHFPENDLPTVSGAGPILADSTAYGLRAYLLSNVDNQSGGGHKTPSVANCTTMADAILALVVAGTALTEAIVDAIVAAVNASSDLTGNTAGGSTSTGSIEELLRILSGEVYRLSDGATIGTGGGADFVGSVGDFVTAPTVVLDLGTGPDNAGAMYGLPVLPQSGPIQTGTEDVNFRNIRQVEHTGILDISVANGNLSELKAATFDWENPAFTYVATTGTATDVAGTILTTTVARGVVVYDVAGNVI